MNYVSFLLVLSILFTSVPVDLAFAQGPENEVNPMLAGFLDIFTRKANENADEARSGTASTPIEEPKLTIGDKISSWWDNLNISGLFSGSEADRDSLAPVSAPVSVKNPPILDPSPEPITSVKDIEPDAAADKNSGNNPSERSYIKDAGEFLLKSQVISIPVTAITVGFMTVMRTYVSSTLGVRFIIQTTGKVLILPARVAMLSVWGATTAGSGAVLYLASKSGQWPFNDEHPGIKRFGDNFRSATDNSILTPISNIYHSIVPRRSQRVSSPNIEEKLENAGTLFKGEVTDQPKQSDTQSVPYVEEEIPVNYSDPDNLKPMVNISGYLNLTYYNCPDYNLGPYQDDWSAKLNRKPDTTDVAYLGSIEIPDFTSVGNVDVAWDQSAGKWKVGMKSQYFSVTSLINSFAEDLSQGRLTGDLKIKPEALVSLGFGQCTAGAGSFGGSIVK